MERDPDQQVDDTDLPEIDFRSVGIYWHEGLPKPEITDTTCSVWETIGLLFTSCLQLALENPLMDREEDDEA